MTARLTPATKRGFTIAASTSHYFQCRLSALLLRSTGTLKFRPLSLYLSRSRCPDPWSQLFSHSSSSSSSSLPFRSCRAMATIGDARPKRKQSPVSFLDRPAKHLKPEASSPTPGDATPQNGTVYSVENEINGAPLLNPLAAPADSPEWQATIENVVKSVVSIHFCQTCSFDTDLSMSSQATGFVVDAERGYIMTNRHVACAGPFWGYCIFDNHEEVSKSSNSVTKSWADPQASVMYAPSIAIRSTTSAS
jgi:hypothetical protein